MQCSAIITATQRISGNADYYDYHYYYDYYYHNASGVRLCRMTKCRPIMHLRTFSYLFHEHLLQQKCFCVNRFTIPQYSHSTFVFCMRTPHGRYTPAIRIINLLYMDQFVLIVTPRKTSAERAHTPYRLLPTTGYFFRLIYLSSV